MTDNLERYENESIEDTLYRLGTWKTNGKLNCTWDDIADVLNAEYDENYCESRYRKLYYQMSHNTSYTQPLLFNTELDNDLRKNIREIEKKRVQIQREKNDYRKDLRIEALYDQIIQLFKEKLERIESINIIQPSEKRTDKVLYALLSDIHYGLDFKTSYSEYNPETAKKRVLDYAWKIVHIGRLEGISEIYVSLLGDLISGIIHDQIRIENSKDIISQIIEVSEIVTQFLTILGRNFAKVHVNSVSGNHSRLNEKDNGLRTERLDDLVFWYCETRFSHCSNIYFKRNDIDPSISDFEILGKKYIAVHGDYDSNNKESARKISELTGQHVDYFIAGHRHVADARFETTTYITNGAVVSGGDDYTSKKRLFGPAVQVSMVCSEAGVESLHPVRL